MTQNQFEAFAYYMSAKIVETTFLVSRFCFLKVGSWLFELRFFVGYLPNQKRRRINEEKLNENEQDTKLCLEPESCYHYLCMQATFNKEWPINSPHGLAYFPLLVLIQVRNNNKWIAKSYGNLAISQISSGNLAMSQISSKKLSQSFLYVKNSYSWKDKSYVSEDLF